MGLLLHPLLWPRDHRPLLAQERRGLGPQQARAQPTRQDPPDQLGDRRDWTKFHDVYTDPEHGVYLGKKSQQFPTVTGELKYIGQDAVAKRY